MTNKGAVMGLFDIFKAKPSKDAILGQVRKAKEVYAQPEYRRMAMEKLLKWGDDESISGLLERFCVVVQSPHWDEDEKRWLVEELVKLGQPVLPLLREFILKKNEVNHALLAYRNIVNDDQAYQVFLIEALQARPPSDHRSVQGKQELIALLGEFTAASLADLLLPYLDDHSDDVQCAAIDALASSSDEAVKAKLISMLASEIHSARVLRKAARVVCDQKMSVGQNIKLSDAVLEDFKISSGYLVAL
jgi:hypothetical protein